MEQRPLRLGDIVDDYCPRERRITNHAIVAIVEDAIRQTRCTTCDAEHIYKRAKEPLRRRGDGSTLVAPASMAVPPVPGSASAADAGIHVADLSASPPPGAGAPAVSPARSESTAQSSEDSEAADGLTEASVGPTHEDGWLAHRQLIRASLPRSENEPPAPRPIPEFTMHQRPPSRGGRGFRFGHGRPGGDGNGNTVGRGDFNGRGGDGRNGNRPGGHGAGRSGRQHGHGKRSR